ncbi:MAG: hypothetical protein PUP92_27925, partial [Rhizonema sp. PD38]|nr:hypothetical protein [Rhizonema sp. PD38]
MALVHGQNPSGEDYWHDALPLSQVPKILQKQPRQRHGITASLRSKRLPATAVVTAAHGKPRQQSPQVRSLLKQIHYPVN